MTDSGSDNPPGPIERKIESSQGLPAPALDDQHPHNAIAAQLNGNDKL